jgi:hypothetical protein
LAVISWNGFKGKRFFNLCFKKFSIPKLLSFTIEIETVDQGNPKTTLPQNAGNIKKAERSNPEIIGGKICYPGVDEEDMWRMFRRIH